MRWRFPRWCYVDSLKAALSNLSRISPQRENLVVGRDAVLVSCPAFIKSSKFSREKGCTKAPANVEAWLEWPIEPTYLEPSSTFSDAGVPHMKDAFPVESINKLILHVLTGAETFWRARYFHVSQQIPFFFVYDSSNWALWQLLKLKKLDMILIPTYFTNDVITHATLHRLSNGFKKSPHVLREMTRLLDFRAPIFGR